MNAASNSARWRRERAVFLDRDDTIIRDVGYLRDPRGLEFLPGAIQALRMLQEKRMALILISNQAGVGRGWLRGSDLERVHARLIKLLGQRGIALQSAYYCPHAPWEGCTCRKPRPGLLCRAAREHGLDPTRSFMVGDKLSDVAAGRRAGCRTVLLGPAPALGTTLAPGPDEVPDQVAPNLLAAAHWIVAQISTATGGRR